MATYAAIADLEAYVDGTAYELRLPAADVDKERLLELAERDLDGTAWPTLPRRQAPAPKVDPADLDAAEQRPALVAAACAQAVYRLEMGDEHFVRAQRQRVQTRAVTAEGRLPILGPEAQRELASAGLFALSLPSHGRGFGAGRDPDLWQRQ